MKCAVNKDNTSKTWSPMIPLHRNNCFEGVHTDTKQTAYETEEKVVRSHMCTFIGKHKYHKYLHPFALFFLRTICLSLNSFATRAESTGSPMWTRSRLPNFTQRYALYPTTSTVFVDIYSVYYFLWAHQIIRLWMDRTVECRTGRIQQDTAPKDFLPAAHLPDTKCL